MPNGEMVGLVGDIGGTNARFAIARSVGDVVDPAAGADVAWARLPDAEAAAQDYINRIGVAAAGGCGRRLRRCGRARRGLVHQPGLDHHRAQPWVPRSGFRQCI